MQFFFYSEKGHSLLKMINQRWDKLRVTQSFIEIVSTAANENVGEKTFLHLYAQRGRWWCSWFLQALIQKSNFPCHLGFCEVKALSCSLSCFFFFRCRASHSGKCLLEMHVVPSSRTTWPHSPTEREKKHTLLIESTDFKRNVREDEATPECREWYETRLEQAQG